MEQQLYAAKQDLEAAEERKESAAAESTRGALADLPAKAAQAVPRKVQTLLHSAPEASTDAAAHV